MAPRSAPERVDTVRQGLAWTTVDELVDARYAHAAAPLGSGRVLVCGGRGGAFGESYIASCEIFSGSRFSAGASLPTGRYAFTLTPMEDGTVLAVGGGDDDGFLSDVRAYTWSAAGGSFAPRAPLLQSRFFHKTVALADGRILVSGGTFSNASQVPVSAPNDEILVNGAWTAIPGTQRAFHSVTPLQNGTRAFAFGGTRSVQVDTRVVATFLSSENTFTSNGTGGSWSPSIDREVARERHIAVLLRNGRVLVAGGRTGTNSSPVYLNEARLYDPSTESWSDAGAMSIPRANHAAALIQGKVVVAGGLSSSLGTAHRSVEMYDPETNEWHRLDDMEFGRSDFTLTAIDDTHLLAAGGADEQNQPLGSAEVLWVKALGEPCSVARDCASNLCVDDYCCSAPCEGSCQACDVRPTPGDVSLLGTCSPVTGAPHGTRMCPAGQLCRSGACDDSCASDGECPASFYCNGTRCVAKKEAGNAQACERDAECSNGRCVDGYCCTTDCAGRCEACNEAGNLGTCVLISGPPRGERLPCSRGTMDPDCGLRCDGTDPDECAFTPEGETCGEASCTLNEETRVGSCDGSGLCESESNPCRPYICAVDACRTECADDGDCGPQFRCANGSCVTPAGLGRDCSDAMPCEVGQFCVLTNPGAVPAEQRSICCDQECDSESSCSWSDQPFDGICFTNNGKRCAEDGECGSGSCMDGVCCNAECDGQCQACDVVAGECQFVDGAPRGDRPACRDEHTCRGGECTPIDAHCLDENTSVFGDVQQDCGEYKCIGARGVCAESCSSSDDCADAFVCDTPSRRCVPVQEAPEQGDPGCGCRVPGSATSRGLGAGPAALLLALAFAARRQRAPRRARSSA